jgi:hypothetical protein
MKRFDFTLWLSGKQAVSLTLFSGVSFLLVNYAGVLLTVYPFHNLFDRFALWLSVWFFSFATVLIIFQGVKTWQKVAYCIFEGCMVWLHLNIEKFKFSHDALTVYLAVFSAFTLYLLGELAKHHQAQNKPNTTAQNGLNGQIKTALETLVSEPMHANGKKQ